MTKMTRISMNYVYGLFVIVGAVICFALYKLRSMRDELNRYEMAYDLRPSEVLSHSPIPKMIHQIWIGKEIPPKFAGLVAQMKSVHEALGYQHRLWGNELWDIYEDDPYIQSYKDTSIPLAYITDRFRLLLLRDYGGISVDPDCEVVRSFDTILEKIGPTITYFAGLRPAINSGALIECGIQGTTKNSRVIREFLNVYTKKGFAPGGKITSDKMIKIVDTDVALLNWEHFFDKKKGPRTILFHEAHTLGSWR